MANNTKWCPECHGPKAKKSIRCIKCTKERIQLPQDNPKKIWRGTSNYKSIKEYMKEYYKKNPDKFRAYRKKYYQKIKKLKKHG